MAARGQDEAPENELVQQFASVTGVEANVARFYLEMGGGNIQAALDQFYDSTGNSPSVLAQCSGTGEKDSPLLIPDEDSPAVAGRTDAQASENLPSSTRMPPPPLKIMSWNIDGLDEQNLEERTRAVCGIINSRKPDAVFLQEVVPESLPMLQTGCASYRCLAKSDQTYFNAILLHKSTMQPSGRLQCTHFHESKMGRHLLTQATTFHGTLQVVLMTSHLESTGACAQERKNQFHQVLNKMQQRSQRVNVIFGGDTNLRDKEVASIGGLPPGIVDMWEACGSPLDAKFSWDIGLNDNLDWPPGRGKPKCRFDRLFLRRSHPASLVPQRFEFVGKSRLPGCDRFPSDHWGLLTELCIAGE